MFQFALMVSLLGFSFNAFSTEDTAPEQSSDQENVDSSVTNEIPRVFLFRAEAPAAKPQLLQYEKLHDEKFKNTPIIVISKNEQDPSSKVYETKQMTLETKSSEVAQPSEE